MFNSENAPDKKQGQNNVYKLNNSISKNNRKSKHYSILKGFNCIKNEKIFILYNHLKRPISPLTGKVVGINDKKHFVDLKTALNALYKYKNVLGVGIILGDTTKDNICAIDIDDCVSKNDRISKEANQILELFKDTYAEYSQSGKGLHIIFFEKKKRGCMCKISRYEWCKNLECYDSGHYIALTGNILERNSSLMDCQNELNTFCDKYLKMSLKLIKNEPTSLNKLKEGLERDKKFIQLWQGVRYFDDESRNDLALMAKILYWCGYDINYAIEAFRTSPYAAQKDHLHKFKLSRSDYLIRTAKKCLEGVQNGKL